VLGRVLIPLSQFRSLLDTGAVGCYDQGVMRTQSPDTSPEAERVLVALLRRTPPWRRLQLADHMSRSVRGLSLAGLRARYPKASEAELRRRFADIYLGPKLAAEVYGVPPTD
jgi:hypothetical protein